MSMRVLLTKADAEPSPATVLVLPQLGGSTFETLAGDRVDVGFVGELADEPLTEAVYAGAKERDDDVISAKELVADVRWLHRHLADYQPGSKIGLTVDEKNGGYILDDSEATRINRAENLAEGDEVAFGPAIKPKTLFNTHGRATSINGEMVEVTFDPGDRERIERATGKTVPAAMSFHIAFLERVG